MPSAPTCVGTRTDDDNLLSVDATTGTFSGLQQLSSAFTRQYRHRGTTTHLASVTVPATFIPTAPHRPDCDGLARDWDAKVAKTQRGQPVDSHEWLIVLSNMARGSCPAEITVACNSIDPSDALTIQPFTTPHDHR